MEDGVGDKEEGGGCDGWSGLLVQGGDGILNSRDSYFIKAVYNIRGALQFDFVGDGN